MAGDEDRVGALGFRLERGFQHGGDVGGVVLAVAIEGGDESAVGGFHAGNDGGTLAAAVAVADADERRQGGGDVRQDLRAVV